jgi:hypothetical protein
VVSLQTALSLAQGIGTEATEDTIFSGKNMQLIDDADLVDTYLDNDEHFRPNFSIVRSFDLLFGAHGSTTPLQYHIDCRRFYYISQGNLVVKSAP